MKTVLIVTHQRGFEADPVIDALRQKGIPVFRFNTDSGSDASAATIRIGENGSLVRLWCDGRTIEAEEIGVGWYQQVPPYLGQPATKTETLQRENLFAAHLAAFDACQITWFNSPRAVLEGSKKAEQLFVAKRVGIKIPETLISNSPSEIRAFAGGRKIIAKNLATPWIISSQGTCAAYTKLVHVDELGDGAFAFSPVIYQEYCKRARDIRVVIVGEKIFCAACKPGPDQIEDVRKGQATGELYVRHDIDKQTILLLKKLMKHFDLQYCAADFMEDESGNLFFLEINTCGAWWWVDKLFGGQICSEIAWHLARKIVE